MISANMNEDIILTLQLVKSDGTSYETDATISYKIMNDTGTDTLVSGSGLSFNNRTKSYTTTITPSADWTNQVVGTYLVVYIISSTDDDFPTHVTETLQINIDEDKIDRILALVHQNMVIDDTYFDGSGNLYSARVTLYRDSAKTQVLARYRITANPTGPGKFSTWEQVEI